MRWIVHSDKPLYSDPWLDIRLADVELPDGRHLEHRVIRTPPGAGAVVTDEHRRVLLLWRHRFITDTWGWEIPVGRAEPGEGPAEAAAREVEEETGWRPGPLRPLPSILAITCLRSHEPRLFRLVSTYASSSLGELGLKTRWLMRIPARDAPAGLRLAGRRLPGTPSILHGQDRGPT